MLSSRLRQLAAAVGRVSGHDVDGSIAAWVWSDHNWSPHRYQVSLSFMHAAAGQLAADDSWPSDAPPDLLECALCTTAWETSERHHNREQKEARRRRRGYATRVGSGDWAGRGRGSSGAARSSGSFPTGSPARRIRLWTLWRLEGAGACVAL
ncbi:hypothetical protein ACFXDO_16725 [Streptomyces nigra]|uniref:hypothetical protein n=1 Tax=Streptomyces nigra TaxID=1827580 RepID=UPI0036B7EB44